MLSGKHWRIHVGDVMTELAGLPKQSVHCVVTSPPYWGLRDYGFDGQIGLERTPEEYVDRIVDVFREVRRVLRDDGVLFVNLGDTYATGAGIARNPGSRHYGKHDSLVDDSVFPTLQPGRLPISVPPGNLVGIPWRVAFALQADGWILRSCIVWDKPAPMPESVCGTRWVRCRVKVAAATNVDHGKNANYIDRRKVGFNERYDNPEENAAKWKDCPGCQKCEANGGYVLRRGSWRPSTSHEFIFMFAKYKRYFCDGDGSKEPTSGTAHSRGNGINPKCSAGGLSRQNASFSGAVSELVETRNMRSVWRVSSESYKEAHFACYPTELVRRCLIAATSRGGCCSQCGSQYAPVVESRRIATRPGKDSKVTKRDLAIANGSRPGRPDHPNLVGNRDPQRHTTTTVVTGYRATCQCNAPVSRPVVLDCFSGSATTGQVAIHMGCDYIGLEGKPEYAELGVKRLNTPWAPKATRAKRAKRKKHQVTSRGLFD